MNEKKLDTYLVILSKHSPFILPFLILQQA